MGVGRAARDLAERICFSPKPPPMKKPAGSATRPEDASFFFFDHDFWRDYRSMTARGVKFAREPKEEPYGTVAVFEDLYGNKWDLLQLKPAAQAAP